MKNKEKLPIKVVVFPNNNPVVVSVCRYNANFERVARLYYPSPSSLARIELLEEIGSRPKNG